MVSGTPDLQFEVSKNISYKEDSVQDNKFSKGHCNAGDVFVMDLVFSSLGCWIVKIRTDHWKSSARRNITYYNCGCKNDQDEEMENFK